MLIVYAHKLKSDDRKIIDKMMSSVSIEDYEVVDLMAVSYNEKDPRPAVTIGTIPNRLVKNKLCAFPEISVFTGALTEEKKLIRKQVYESLRELAENMKKSTVPIKEIERVEETIFEKPHTLEEFKRMWYSQENGRITHIIINSAGKRICVYNNDKPSLSADMFYTVAEFAALLDLMNIFGAKNLLIYREGKEGHEI